MHQRRWLLARPKAKGSRGKPVIGSVSQVHARLPQDSEAFGSSVSAHGAGSSVPPASRNVARLLATTGSAWFLPQCCDLEH